MRFPIPFISSAVAYLSIADESKIYYEPIFIKQNFRLRGIYHNKIFFNIPMARINEKIKNCTIDGYDFVILKCKKEYVEAGKMLCNCLDIWNYTAPPVVAIKKDNKVVGAIEINDSIVLQASGYDNSHIDDTDFYSAFLKFCEDYGLSKSPYLNI